MKKLFLFASITLLSVSFINAQDSKTKGGFDEKDIYATGSLGFNSISVSGVDSDVSTFIFSPSVGYFVSENVAVELGLAIGTSDTENSGIKSNSFGVNLGGIYYFTPKKSFSFLVGGAFSYLSESGEVNGNDVPKRNSFGFGIVPGINYFVSNSIALRATVGALSYTTSKQDIDGAPSVNNFSVNLNLSNVNFGITYKF